MTLDMQAHLTRQIAWSRTCFGPGARLDGVIDHIRKELREVEESGGSTKEWVDVAILALDGLWRSIAFQSHAPYFGLPSDHVARSVIDALTEKQAHNELRDWPDWRTADPTKAIEHVRPTGHAPERKANPSGGDQKAEFEAVAKAADAMRRLPPIVDDDYPAKRHAYEGAIRGLVQALAANGRIPQEPRQ